jgi:hypothetical protein
MKNLFLTPTDKPSRLHFFTPEIQLSKEINSIVEGRNIYIISYEEENVGWCLDLDTFKLFNLVHWRTDRAKKIILTTDPDLIAHGVQAIDDEFLEWFVKNPSCEFVEVSHQLHKDEPLYKIIIPQEETDSIPTAKEYIRKNLTDYWDGGVANYTEKDVEQALIEFAKLHVKYALEQLQKSKVNYLKKLKIK